MDTRTYSWVIETLTNGRKAVKGKGVKKDSVDFSKLSHLPHTKTWHTYPRMAPDGSLFLYDYKDGQIGSGKIKRAVIGYFKR